MIASRPGHRTQFLISGISNTNFIESLNCTEVSDDVDDAEDETAGAEESQVRAALVSHFLVRCLPAGDVVEHSLGGAKRILRVVGGVVEDFDDQHEDEDEYESGVEVGDVEGCSKSSDESVASDDSCEEHSGQLRAEVSDQTEDMILL